MSSSQLILPSSSLSLCHDRFSLTDTDTDDPIPFWLILGKILTPAPQSTSQLLDALNTISVTLRGHSHPHAFLRRFLDVDWDAESFFRRTWPACITIALEMPLLFPSGYLEPLTAERPTQTYTSRQIACLVIHQFLCTLPKLPWTSDAEENSQDLHIWYDDEQPHPGAVRAYLTALFTFFERVASGELSSDDGITFTLHCAPDLPISNDPLYPLRMMELDKPAVNSSLIGLPSGACVISANRHIGFGRTASQEEMHVGCTPQSFPAKLVTPPLGDSQVLVVRGCALVVEMSGYGRDAGLTCIVPESQWRQRTMLFMDALELDGYNTTAVTPDLLPGNVDRELTKAYTAFSSGRPPYVNVVTGHWGCRAFGGNREIKSLIQWCAASLAGVELDFVCELRGDPFADKFRRFSLDAQSRRWSVSDILSVLRSMDPVEAVGRSAFDFVREALGQDS
ncbi:hypothetical protein FB45DRAFT_847552 [Roridomyces roridus]|uniref:poly(ADP-ribose) glycohydrolase n=1 Tax=Roridomyces roridus TaxID=1738132 RepID=A0AAD7B124_9AGAR|nr:hypothetical protein FB45DRAFT_847552 [Roridomyces roridus]